MTAPNGSHFPYLFVLFIQLNHLQALYFYFFPKYCLSITLIFLLKALPEDIHYV